MRVAIYLRSASVQERIGFEEQRERCMAYVSKEGHEVVAVYKDNGASGLDNERPGLQAMLTAANSGTFEGLIVDNLDRLSRDVKWYQGYLIDQLHHHNVRLLTTHTKLGRFVRLRKWLVLAISYPAMLHEAVIVTRKRDKLKRRGG